MISLPDYRAKSIGTCSLFTLVPFSERLIVFKSPKDDPPTAPTTNCDIDSLFEETSPKKRSRPVSEMIGAPVTATAASSLSKNSTNAVSERIVRDTEKRIRMSLSSSSSSGGGEQKRALLEAWEEQWQRDGKDGKIGLVPAPFEKFFPNNPHKCVIDSPTRDLLEHFAQWVLKQQQQ